MTQTDLPQNIHFEIIGSKGLLGEERRSAQTSQVTAFWMQVNPQMLNQVELAKEMYRDAGNKNPERFLAVSDEYAAIMQQVEAFQQQAQQQIAELEQEIASYQMQDQEHSLELQGKELEKKQLQLRIEALNSLLRIR